MREPLGRVSIWKPRWASSTPQAESAPAQYVSPVDAVMPDCAGVGNRCGFDSLPVPTIIALPEGPRLRVSASTTQSALPAISALVASKRTLLEGTAEAAEI